MQSVENRGCYLVSALPSCSISGTWEHRARRPPQPRSISKHLQIGNGGGETKGRSRVGGQECGGLRRGCWASRATAQLPPYLELFPLAWMPEGIERGQSHAQFSGSCCNRTQGSGQGIPSAPRPCQLGSTQRVKVRPIFLGLRHAGVLSGLHGDLCLSKGAGGGLSRPWLSPPGIALPWPGPMAGKNSNFPHPPPPPRLINSVISWHTKGLILCGQTHPSSHSGLISFLLSFGKAPWDQGAGT